MGRVVRSRVGRPARGVPSVDRGRPPIAIGVTVNDAQLLARADESEQCVLGIALNSPNRVMDVCRLLSPEDFFVPAHQAVAQALHDLNDAREPIDPVHVWARVRANGDERAVPDGILYMHTLSAAAPSAFSLDVHAKTVKEASARRRLARLGTMSHQLSADPASGSVAGIVDTLRAQLDAVSDDVSTGQVPTVAGALDDVLAEVERLGTDGAVVGVPTGFPDLDAKLHGLRPGQMITLAGRPAMGKALALDTPIPTPTGWASMGELVVGDEVLGSDGAPTRVVAVTDTMTERACFEVLFSDEERVVADGGHLWVVDIPDLVPGGRSHLWRRSTVTTADLQRVVSGGVAFVSAAQPVAGPSSLLPASPFAVGRFLSGAAVHGVVWALQHLPEAACCVTATGEVVVPEAFLRGSLQQRLEMAYGVFGEDLAARDGHVEDVVFRADRWDLASVVRELLCTLGCVPLVSRNERDGQYAVFLSGHPTSGLPVDGVVENVTHRRVVAVQPVASVPVRCIQVAAPDGVFLAGRAFIPTHNSTLMLDFVRSAAFNHEKSVLVFSLEMSMQEVVMRMLSAQARIEMDSLQTGSLSEEEWQRIHRTYARIQQTRIGIDDSSGLTVADIRARARAFQAEQGLDVIAVDYLQLLSPVRRSDSRQQEVAEMSRNLKLIAKEFGVPVIALSQLNRASEQRSDRRPMLSDLRDSGAVEQDSDVVILLHRDEVYNPEVRVGEADLIIAKQRSGPTGIVPVVSQLHYSRFMPAARTFDDGQGPGGF